MQYYDKMKSVLHAERNKENPDADKLSFVKKQVLELQSFDTPFKRETVAKKYADGGSIKLSNSEKTRLDILQEKEDHDELTESEEKEYNALVLKYRETDTYKKNQIKHTKGGDVEAKKKASSVKDAASIATFAYMNDIVASNLSFEQYSKEVQEKSGMTYSDEDLKLAYGAMKDTGYEKGGEVDVLEAVEDEHGGWIVLRNGSKTSGHPDKKSAEEQIETLKNILAEKNKMAKGGEAYIHPDHAEYCSKGMEVQSILIPKDKYNMLKARKWLKQHEYNYALGEATKTYYRFRQAKPSKFNKESFRTISFGDSGIQAVVACPKVKKFSDGGGVGDCGCSH